MKLSIISALLSMTAFVAATPLEKRDDCGKGQAPYTRRTNSPCNTFDHTYCGCDQTGIVACTGGYWREIMNCGDSPHFRAVARAMERAASMSESMDMTYASAEREWSWGGDEDIGGVARGYIH